MSLQASGSTHKSSPSPSVRRPTATPFASLAPFTHKSESIQMTPSSRKFYESPPRLVQGLEIPRISFSCRLVQCSEFPRISVSFLLRYIYPCNYLITAGPHCPSYKVCGGTALVCFAHYLLITQRLVFSRYSLIVCWKKR